MRSLRKLLRPAIVTYHWLHDYPLESKMRFLEGSQWWSRKEIDEYKDEKLRSLVLHAYNNVPYYRKVMDQYGIGQFDIQSVHDLIKMPILTKQMVRKHYKDLIAVNINSKRTFDRASGGSTGVPVQVLKDYNTFIWSNACLYRGMHWGGYSLGQDTIAQLSCGSLGLKSKTPFDKFKALVMGYVAIPAEEGLSELKVHHYRDVLLKSGAKYLKGYPSLIYLLSKFFEAAGIEDVKFKAIFSTAETLFDFQRDKIQRIFEGPVFNYYGSREITGLGCECEKHNGHHIHEEHVIIEAVQGESCQVVFNKPGRFLVTDLDNYAMPLIRYENGDAGVISTSECTCGRKLRLISKLYGRVQDFLVTEDGNLISGIFFRHLLALTRVKGIDEYQVIQESKNLIRLLVVKNEYFNDDEMHSIIKTIKRYFGSGMKIELEIVSEIPKTKSGKKLTTICKIADNYGINQQISSESLVEF